MTFLIKKRRFFYLEKILKSFIENERAFVKSGNQLEISSSIKTHQQSANSIIDTYWSTCIGVISIPFSAINIRQRNRSS